ncbi:unnamed protein product [Parajaminaea phylloscopi]
MRGQKFGSEASIPGLAYEAPTHALAHTHTHTSGNCELVAGQLTHPNPPDKMANPRQRRKARSGSSTKPSATAKRHIKKKLVRAPTVKGPDVLREQWDGKKTVRQNYEALGLVADAKLRPSGGTEHTTPAESSTSSSKLVAGPSKGMGRIVRDEEGNVIDIVLEDDEEEEQTPWGKSMKGWEEDAAADGPANSKSKPSSSSSSKAVQALEAMPDHGPIFRHVSELEAHWLLSVVRKHGRDVDAMFMDKKLNELQKTKGEIRSRIKRAGGFEKIEEAIAREHSTS